MDWQLTAVIGILAGAVTYLGRRAWRSWFARKGGCGGGCDCSAKPPAQANGHVTLVAPEQLRLRRRNQ